MKNIKKFDQFLSEEVTPHELKLNPYLVERHFISKLSDSQLRQILKELDEKQPYEELSRTDLVGLIFGLMD